MASFVDAFIRLDSNRNSPSHPMRNTYDEPDIMAEFFGHIVTVVHCAGDRIIDVATRVLTQLEGIDKFSKFMGGCFLGVRIFNNDTGVYSVVAAFAQERLKVLASTIAGFNILGRINEFTKRGIDDKRAASLEDSIHKNKVKIAQLQLNLTLNAVVIQLEAANRIRQEIQGLEKQNHDLANQLEAVKKDVFIKIFRESSGYKIGSRAVLAVANVCETLKLIEDFGGKVQVLRLTSYLSKITATAAAAIGSRITVLGAVAARIGQTTVFQYVVKLHIKNSFVILSCLLSLADVAKTFKDKGIREMGWKEALTVSNEMGKMACIIGAELLGITMTWTFVGFILVTNMSALAKIALDDYKSENEKKADQAKKAMQSAELASLAEQERKVRFAA